MCAKQRQPKKKQKRLADLPDSPASVGIVQSMRVRLFDDEAPLSLESGLELAPIDVVYEVYGTPNADKSNVVFVFHALTGSAHAAGWHDPDTDKEPGWWDSMIGPNKPLDTNRYFIVCPNFLGSCYGTTGPTSINPATGRPYGREFPIITVEDMVKVHRKLLEHLNIDKPITVIGGSLGGMQALEWGIRYPDMCRACIAIATSAAVNAQAIAWDAIGRQAVYNDPEYHSGLYNEKNAKPSGGLAIARMIGHITYLSDQGMTEKFGRNLRFREEPVYDFASEFSVETYLDHQGQKFVDRFDANAYLYITKAMDYYDLAKRYGTLNRAFRDVKARFLIVSFTSDWLFPAYQSKDIVKALMNNDKDVTYLDIDSFYGHDAFLVEWTIMDNVIRSFLESLSVQEEAWDEHAKRQDA